MAARDSTAGRWLRLDPARHAGSALLSAQSDDRLVALARAGNDRAFEAIVHRYHRALLRHCARVLPAGRAEDAVQQTFLKAHAALRGAAADIQLRPWLYKIARNTSLNLLRENGWSYEPLDERIDGVERPPEAFERRERLRATVGALQRLPRRQRDALVLRELEGRSYDEIARTLTVSDGAVRQLINRARTTLRAGATALTPSGLLVRLAGATRAGSAVERASAAGAGASGLAGIAKLSAGILAGGALVAGGGSAVLQSSPQHGRHAHAPGAGSNAPALRAAAAGAAGARSVDRRGVAASAQHAAAGHTRGRPVSGGGFTRTGDGGASGDRRHGRGSDGSSVVRHDSGGDRGGSAATSSGDGGHSGTDGHSQDGGGATGALSDRHSSSSGDGGSASGTSSSGSESGDGTSSGSSGGGGGASSGGSGSGDSSTTPSVDGH